MVEIDVDTGVAKALDALNASRLALLCGAGLSMASPSMIPSAAALALKAKQKYDATYGVTRPPLPPSIDDQAQFFFDRNELQTVYLTTYIDRDAFSAVPNGGHFAVADLLLVGAITTAVSTNVDTLIEASSTWLYGHVGVGTNRTQVAAVPADVSPLLKIHGCWSDPSQTIWAKGQVAVDPLKTRIEDAAEWLSIRLLDRDLVIVGYWTDWDYLNEVLDVALNEVSPSRVIVVDPCDTASFEAKAPALFALGQRATAEFCHVKCSGDVFLDKLRVLFSQSFVRRVLHTGAAAFEAHTGAAPNALWLEPSQTEAQVLWNIRRDLEGRNPNEPAKLRDPIDEPLLGLTLLQLQASGAVAEGSYWNLGGARIRVLRASNRPLHEVQAAFAREVAPAIAPSVTIAVGAEALSLPASIARGSGGGTIARGPSGKWLSRQDAVSELGL